MMSFEIFQLHPHLNKSLQYPEITKSKTTKLVQFQIVYQLQYIKFYHLKQIHPYNQQTKNNTNLIPSTSTTKKKIILITCITKICRSIKYQPIDTLPSSLQMNHKIYTDNNKMKVFFPLTLLLLIVFCVSQGECFNKNEGEKCYFPYSTTDAVCCSCNGTLKCLSGDQCCGQCLGIADYEHCCDKKSKYNYACPNGFLCVSYKNCQQLNLNMFIGISFGIGMILVFGLIIGLSYYFYKKKFSQPKQGLLQNEYKYQ